jgi:hypothetical protein
MHYVMIAIVTASFHGHVPEPVYFDSEMACSNAADAILHSMPVEEAKQMQLVCAPK